MLAFSSLVITDKHFFSARTFGFLFFSVLSYKSTLDSSLNQANTSNFMLTSMHEDAKNTQEILCILLY